MATPIVRQAIYRLKGYSSLDCFGHLRDDFAAMVPAADDALADETQR